MHECCECKTHLKRSIDRSDRSYDLVAAVHEVPHASTYVHLTCIHVYIVHIGVHTHRTTISTTRYKYEVHSHSMMY